MQALKAHLKRKPVNLIIKKSANRAFLTISLLKIAGVRTIEIKSVESDPSRAINSEKCNKLTYLPKLAAAAKVKVAVSIADNKQSLPIKRP